MLGHTCWPYTVLSTVLRTYINNCELRPTELEPRLATLDFIHTGSSNITSDEYNI